MADSCKMDFGGLVQLVQSFGVRGNQAIQRIQPAAAEVLVDAVLEEFETDGRGRWPPLADSTKMGRR